MDTVRRQIEDWRTETAETTLFSATAVQDRLFELYGELREHDAVEQIQQWLTLTVERELFGADEITGFLDQLEGSLPEPQQV
jgi:hypothetical protein